MSFMSWIIGSLNTLVDFFYQVYLEVYSWPAPLWYGASLFYSISLIFSDLAWDFYQFSNWVTDVQGKVADILSWPTILSYILGYVPNLASIRDWFYNWTSNVQGVVTGWWYSASVTVQGWISTAVQPFNTMLTAWDNFWDSLWPQLTISYNGLKSAWDNFRSYTLPELVTFGWLGTWWNSRVQDVQGLIDSAFMARDSLWAGWQDMRAEVSEFFSEPLEWLWSRTADWFLGPET